MFCRKLNPCAICGGHIISDAIVEQDTSDGRFHQFCSACAQTSKCGICTLSKNCRFYNTNVHPELPTYVMKVQQQGSMTIQRQVLNDKRIEAVCKDCPCYNSNDKEQHCLKEQGSGCKNFKVNWRD